MSGGQHEILVGIVGFGPMGAMHAGVMNAMEGCRLGAVAESNGTVRRVLRALRPDLRVVKDYRHLLDGSVDAVVIATPTSTHVEIAMACAEQGIPFLVEKPLARTAGEGRRLVQLVEDSRIPSMVGFSHGYRSPYLRGQQLLREGGIGSPQFFQASVLLAQVFAPLKGWRGDSSIAGGGVVMTHGCHMLSILLKYFGAPTRIVARTQHLQEHDVEDAAHIMLKFADGVEGFVEISWSAHGHVGFDSRITIHGEKGRLDVSADEIRMCGQDRSDPDQETWHILTAPELASAVPIDIGAPEYARQDLEFLDAVQTGARPANDVRHGYAVHQVIDAIYASARAGGMPVEIEGVAG